MLPTRATFSSALREERAYPEKKGKKKETRVMIERAISLTNGMSVFKVSSPRRLAVQHVPRGEEHA